MRPLGAWCIKKFDERFQEKIRPGFEMLVNNFSAGIIGFILIILAFLAVGPVVSSLTDAIGVGVQAVINAKSMLNYCQSLISLSNLRKCFSLTMHLTTVFSHLWELNK